MRKLACLLVALLMNIIACGPSFAADFGTKDEAQAMTEKAVAYYAANGKEKAFAAFNAGTDGFKDRDLYLFVYDKDGICVSHGANPQMIGKNLLSLKDADGKEMIKAIVATDKTAWVDFKWRNPQTQEVMQKQSYIIHSGDYWFGVGAYTK